MEDICASARQLHGATAPPASLGAVLIDDRVYETHLAQWHALLDLAKTAVDPQFATWASNLNAGSRNAVPFFNELGQVVDYACSDHYMPAAGP